MSPPGGTVAAEWAEGEARQRRRTTRAYFLVLGVAAACWAPIVPYAKERVGADDGTLGLLILCLGLGSLVTMPVSGRLVSLLGARSVLPAAGGLLCLMLPAVALARSPLELGLALAVFGAAAGMLDVGINIQAVAVEKAHRRPMMSGFHAQFSLGGMVGAAGVTGLLALSLPPVAALGTMAAASVGLLIALRGGLLGVPEERSVGQGLVIPRGPVLLLGGMCFVAFLAEGAVMDWSALFLIQERGVDRRWGGIAFAAFAATMTIVRLTGDGIVARFGGRKVVVVGAILAALGYGIVVAVPSPAAAVSGFMLVGLGAANVAPILFTAAGRQAAMPPDMAVAGVATMGYLGLLIGPAAIGGVAEVASLPVSFVGVTGLLLAIALAGRRVAS